MRRIRGVLLRLTRRRAAAIAVGAALAVPAAWVELAARIDAWWLNGLALVFGATGIALMWAGFSGPRSDWRDS